MEYFPASIVDDGAMITSVVVRWNKINYKILEIHAFST